MKDDRTFGQRLRETRVAAGMSQSNLEERSGIPKARLSRYENGHVAPSIQTLERLSRALNVSEASLLGDQRAMLEEFFNVLYDRGVRITSTEQAARLGAAVADMFQSLQLQGPGDGAEDLGNDDEAPIEPARTIADPAGRLRGFPRPRSMASVTEWLDGQA